jgi:hypothetical protein
MTPQPPNLHSKKNQSASLLLWIFSGLYVVAMVSFLMLSPIGMYGPQEAQPWLAPAVVLSTVSYGILTLLLWADEINSFEARPERRAP